MITLAYADIVLTLIAIAITGGAIVGTVFAVKAMAVLREAAEASSRIASAAERFEELQDEVSVAVVDLRRVLAPAADIAHDASAVTHAVRYGAVPVVDELSRNLSAAASGLRHVRAASHGLKVALEALGDRDRNGGRARTARI